MPQKTASNESTQELDLSNITKGYLDDVPESEYDDSLHLRGQDNSFAEYDSEEDEENEEEESTDADTDTDVESDTATSTPKSTTRFAEGHEVLISSEDLVLYIRNGIEVQKCKDLLVRYNIGLVNKEARRCQCAIPFQDKMQYGYMGLLKAIETFDLSQGILFSTYCTASIFQTIQRHANLDGRIVHLPEYMSIDLARVYKYCNDNSNRVLDPEEVAKETGVPVNRVRNMLVFGAPKVHSYMSSGTDSEEGRGFVEVYPGDSLDYKLDVENLDSDAGEVLEAILDHLPKDEREFVARVHGLDGFEPMSLDEIAKTDLFKDQSATSTSTLSRRYNAILKKVQRIVQSNGITYTFDEEL